MTPHPLRAACLLCLALLALPAGASRAAALPRLQTRGAQIVDDAGHTVTLRGVNLGGWLVEEPWMQPFVLTPPDGSPLPPSKTTSHCGGPSKNGWGRRPGSGSRRRSAGPGSTKGTLTASAPPA